MKETVFFPQISKTKQQSIYGANGSGDSGFDPYGDDGYGMGTDNPWGGGGDDGGGSETDWDDVYDDLGDAFGEDYGGASDSYGGGGGSGSENYQDSHPENVDLQGDDTEIVNSIFDLMDYVVDNDYSGIELDDVFTNLGSGAGAGMAGALISGFANFNGVLIQWSVTPAFNPSNLSQLWEGHNELDYVIEEHLSDGRVFVKIMDNDSGGSRVVLRFQNNDDYQGFKGRVFN